MKTLGICIPTYKRPDFLKRCVLSAIESAEGYPIRIFIADDSASDVNDAVLAELVAAWPCVSAHQNPANLGLDNNIQRSVDLCNCDYAWIVGEDDYFLPGSVRRVVDRLQHADHAFVFANYAYVGDRDDSQIGRALDQPDGLLSGIDFIDRYLWAAGFIGACIVDRQRWGSTSPDPYKGTYYTHVGRICEMLAPVGSTVCIICQACVANRVEGTDTFTWRNDSYGVFFGFQDMCEAVARDHPGIAAAARNAATVMEKHYGWLSLKVAMRLRSGLGYDYAQYRRYLAPGTGNPFKRLAFMLISVAPPWTFRPLVAAHRWMRRAAAR